MATLNIGQVCMKTAGREAGRYCVVIKKMDNNFVLITGPKELTQVKRRRCNIDHLEPVSYFLEIKEEAGDKQVVEAYEKAGVLKKLGLKKPSPEKLKKEKTKKTKKKKKSIKEKVLGKKKKSSKKSKKKAKESKKKSEKKSKESKKKTKKTRKKAAKKKTKKKAKKKK